jgi:hypothetical protein
MGLAKMLRDSSFNMFWHENACAWRVSFPTSFLHAISRKISPPGLVQYKNLSKLLNLASDSQVRENTFSQ